MMFVRLLPVILSFLILSAHFSRDNQPILMLIALGFPLLLLIKKPWIPKLFQIVLMLGALEWLRSMYFYVQTYIEREQSWTRLALIIGGVALFTGLSALVFRIKSVRKRYS